MPRGRVPKTEPQRKHEKDRNSAAMARVFGGIEPTREDCVRVQDMLQKICNIDVRGPVGGLDGLVDLVRRDAMRSVYLDIMDGINAGRRVIDDGGAETLADSGGEE